MILAAPLVIPFAKAVPALAGIMGGIGMAALSDRVNEYIQENPEESMKILSTIIPGAGIGQIFMSKEDKISLEDLEDMTDEEAQDLTKEEKAELMKQAGKTSGKNKRQTMIDIAGKLGLGGEGREKQDMEYEVDERYDEGGVEDAPKPKFDYTKFFRKRRADGGAIGIEVLFREKKNLGGLLTGQAKSIYDTMMAAGYFTEDEIKNAIINAGYEIPGETPTQDTGIIASAPNIINQGGGGDGPPIDPPKDPFGGLGFSSANFGLGPNQDVMDYEADAAKTGRTIRGQFAKGRLGIQNLISKMRSLPTPLNIALNLAGKVGNFLDPQRETREAIARESVRDLQDRIDKGQFGSPTPTPQDAARGGGGGRGGHAGGAAAAAGAAAQAADDEAAGAGGYNKGGLATMFMEKR
jgi:hypothetical protein